MFDSYVALAWLRRVIELYIRYAFHRYQKEPRANGDWTFADALFNLAIAYIAKRFPPLHLYWLIGGRVHAVIDRVIDRNVAKGGRADRDERCVILDPLVESIPNGVAFRGQIDAARRGAKARPFPWVL